MNCPLSVTHQALSISLMDCLLRSTWRRYSKICQRPCWFWCDHSWGEGGESQSGAGSDGEESQAKKAGGGGEKDEIPGQVKGFDSCAAGRPASWEICNLANRGLRNR